MNNKDIKEYNKDRLELKNLMNLLDKDLKTHPINPSERVESTYSENKIKEMLLKGIGILIGYRSFREDPIFFWLTRDRIVNLFSLNQKLNNSLENKIELKNAVKIIQKLISTGERFITYHSDFNKEMIFEKYFRHELELVDGIGGTIKDKLIENGIDTLEKLKKSNIKDLTEIYGIGKSFAKKFLNNAVEAIKYQKRIEMKKSKRTQKTINIFQKFI